MSLSQISKGIGSYVSKGIGSYGKMKLIIFLGIFVFVFGKGLISDIGQAFSSTVTATITDRIKECRARIQNSPTSNTRVTMPCKQADALKRADQTHKTRVYKKTYVVLSYTLKNGIKHTTRVREHKVRARKLPIGSEIQIAYDPRNPNKVKLPKSLWKISKSALWLVGSVLALALAFFGHQTLTTFFKNIKRPQGRSGDRRTIDEIMAHVENYMKRDTAPSETKHSQVRPKPVARPRARKKTAPIPKRGGVVSKRRGGLFWFTG